MRRDELETRLRSPRRREHEYAKYRDRPGRMAAKTQTFQPRASLSAIALLVVFLAALVATRLGGVFGEPGAGPQSSASSTGPQPSKPWISVTPTATPPLSMTACTPGDLSATLPGWGAAGGTTYAPIHLTLQGPVPCRLPAMPSVSILDSGGSVLVSSNTSTTAQVALKTSLIARVGLSSLCSAAAAAVVSLDFGSGTVIRVPLPTGFGARCDGNGSRVSVDDLSAP